MIAHLKNVSPLGAEAGSPSLGTGAFEQAPYSDSYANAGPTCRSRLRSHA